MRQLNKVESILFALGALMMVVGIGCTVFQLLPVVMAPVYAVGSFLFACIQLSQRYHGDSITIKRLRRIMDFADVLFLIAALLLVENTLHPIWTLISSHFIHDYSAYIDFANNYIRYTQNNWVIALLIAAILEMYTMTRISKESEKE